MKILHLTLKKQWFDMILSGEKKEEYREIKPYWSNRFIGGETDFNQWDVICFKNGYKKDSPKFFINLEGIDIGFGKQKWGGNPDRHQYILSLGPIITL